MTTFIVGLLVGGAVGYITAALMQTASAEDDKTLLDEINMFDDEEIHENCTVQVLTNSVTGETSVGWWRNDKPPVNRRENHELDED